MIKTKLFMFANKQKKNILENITTKEVMYPMKNIKVVIGA